MKEKKWHFKQMLNKMNNQIIQPEDQAHSQIFFSTHFSILPQIHTINVKKEDDFIS